MTGRSGDVVPISPSRVQRACSRAFCHSAERVFDTEIGGVRKVTSGTGDVNRTTQVPISRAVDAKCYIDHLSLQAKCTPRQARISADHEHSRDWAISRQSRVIWTRS